MIQERCGKQIRLMHHILDLILHTQLQIQTRESSTSHQVGGTGEFRLKNAPVPWLTTALFGQTMDLEDHS